MNEFTKLAADLRNAGRIEAADHAEKLSAPRQTMMVTNPLQAANGGQAWNGWRFCRVRDEFLVSRVNRDIGQCIMSALRELEENERLGAE
jgi:hypothetical protein